MPMLEVHGLVKIYGRRRVVDGVDFQFTGAITGNPAVADSVRRSSTSSRRSGPGEGFSVAAGNCQALCFAR